MDPIVLDFPFHGRWLAQNSPARRVPSHGTELFGVAYAIDFVAVDERGRSASHGWRSFVSTEPPHIFRGFGVPILAPVGGTVVIAHDGEPDHAARRSQPALLWYALGQAGRVRKGIAAIAGNHAVIALSARGPYVGLVHLRSGSVLVRPGDHVQTGDPLGACGNSGNSTEPHVHVQVTDSIDWPSAQGLPLAFRPPPSVSPGRAWLPNESEIFEIPEAY